MAFVVTALLVFVLTGCATAAPPAPRVDNLCFDRGAFSLGFADLLAPMLAKCRKTDGPAQTPNCVKLETLDEQIRRAIVDAPKNVAPATTPMGIDVEQLMKILGTIGKLAL